MKRKIAVGNLGEEELAQTKRKVLTRAATRAEADLLFANKATQIASKNRTQLGKLFVQAQGAETMSPSIVKVSSVTANVDAFFDKLAEAQKTTAQRRYPELLKASMAPGVATRPSPNLKPRGATPARGAPPAQSSLSGGAA